MPLIALLPCIMSHQFGRRKGNFSEDTYTAIFCSKHHHWAQSHFRFENKDTNCICNPLQKTKPTKSQKSSRSGMRSIKLFISQWTLKTRFWMQVSTPNTFPQVLFKVLTPARHQSKMKYQYNYMTFLSKKPTDSGNPTQLCREDEHLPTENRKKWRNSSVLSVTKDTGKFLPSEDTTLHLMFSVPTFLVKQWLGKFVRATHHWHILESSYRTKTTRTKHGLFSSIFHSNFKYS